MLRLAIDENLHNDIVRGLLRRLPSLDVVRVQDAGLTGRDDPAILAWAASEARVLVTHDVATLVGYAYERVARGEPMPGVIEIGTDLAIRRAIEDLLLIVQCTLPGELDGQVIYLPLR